MGWLENWRYSGVRRGLRMFSPGSGGSQASCWCVQNPCHAPALVSSSGFLSNAKCLSLFCEMYKVVCMCSVSISYCADLEERVRGTGRESFSGMSRKLAPCGGQLGAESTGFSAGSISWKEGTGRDDPTRKGFFLSLSNLPLLSVIPLAPSWLLHRPVSARSSLISWSVTPGSYFRVFQISLHWF